MARKRHKPEEIGFRYGLNDANDARTPTIMVP